MRTSREPCNLSRSARRAAAVIENPRIVVFEGDCMAGIGEVEDALEMLVRWAVRAHLRGSAASDGHAAAPDFAISGAGDST